jgi:putative glycerol-1-phosphate prenyltransferase
MSNTAPIPHDKTDLAVATAMAGEMLGLRVIFMDGGSGAQIPVASDMIRGVHEAVKLPLIVGGGLRTPDDADQAYRAGADVIVVGNAIEEEPDKLRDIIAVRDQINT